MPPRHPRLLRTGPELQHPARLRRRRELVRRVGIAAAYDRTSIDVATPQVRRIRIGYHDKAGGNELHLVIDLASPSARLDRIEPNGRELVIWIGG